MKKFISVLLCIFLFMSVFSCCGKKDVYVVAVDENYYPYSYVNSKKKPAGFEIELMNAICESAGLNVKYEVGAFLDNLTKLDNKDVDVVMEAIIPTEEMNKKYSFSDLYCNDKFAVAVLKGDKAKFLERFNEGLVSITNDGTYAKLYKEYFG